MEPQAGIQLALLRAFESAFREGLLLDNALGAILDAALAFFDASSVALVPTGDGPATMRSSKKLGAAAEERLCRHLKGILADPRSGQVFEAGLAYYGIAVKVNDVVHAAFGVALPPQESGEAPTESLRLFARTISHALERERTLATLMKRREEATALFDLAAGVFHSLNANEVIELTVASLSRELGFDRVKAYRYDADTGEIESILSQGDTNPGIALRRSIDSEEILVRCLGARGPVFDDAEASGGVQRERRQMALPIQADSSVFGFLVMSRRGSFVLTAQEMRLANELAKITAGALERSRLVEAERMNREQLELAKELRSALAGMTDVARVLSRTAEKVGRHFKLEVCALRFPPHGDQPGAAASYVRHGLLPIAPGAEIPDALMERLARGISHVLVPDIATDSTAPAFLPDSAAIKNLDPPISLLAVPVSYQGTHSGVIAAVAGGNPRGFSQATLRSFKGLAAEVSLAVASARLVERERASVRFLERLREMGRPLFSTFDAQRIKEILCQEALALTVASSAHFWDPNPQKKTIDMSARSGEKMPETPRSLPMDRATHPLARAFVQRGTVVDDDVIDLGSNAGKSVIQWVVVPVTSKDELIGLLSVERRGETEHWDPGVAARLALLVEIGALALHNSGLMALVEQQTERDSQTGLFNRKAVMRRLESEIRRAERNGQPLAIAHIRVHGLSHTGPQVGQAPDTGLLSKVSARLTWSTRSTNLVGRDKGNCFWIIIFDANRTQAQRAIQNVQEKFETSIQDVRGPEAGEPLRLTAGISCYPEDAFDVHDLVRTAEQALEEASGRGPGTVLFYADRASVAAAPPMAPS